MFAAKVDQYHYFHSKPCSMALKKWWILIPLVLISLYLIGPRPSPPEISVELPAVPTDLTQLETFISEKEGRHKLKPNNHARIVWAEDSIRQKTPYAILYLHGFSASQAEGDPVHRRIAQQFGCNLYLARLAEHGLDTIEPLSRLKAEDLWKSAKEAYAIAAQLGHKVIVMGTSTGATLALMLAAYYPTSHAQILLSPNIRIFDPNAWLLNNPWGLQVARAVTGSDYVFSDDQRPEYKQYWSYGYRLEAVVELQELLENQMNEDLFRKVTQPVLMLYYYEDEAHQDSVVKVSAMLKMFENLGTDDAKKRAVALPGVGDHVLGSSLKSKDIRSVENEISKFMKDILGLKEQ